MNELYQKSFQTLELDRVLSLLADACATEAGKDLAKALIPATDADDVTKLLQETTDACHMVERKGSPAFRDVKDIKPSLERADRGGALNTRELLRIAAVLRSARNVKEYGRCDPQRGGNRRQRQSRALRYPAAHENCRQQSA